MRNRRHPGVDAVTPIVKSKVSDQVQSYLRTRIVEGDLPEGTRLVEVEIAAELGVSRTPVREALWQLSGMDFVRRLENGGYEVGNVRRELVDILDIRAALECHTARKDAKAIDDAEMTRICESMEALPAEQFERRAKLNRAFHNALINASGNRPLSRLVAGYYEYFEVAQPLFDTAQINKTQREHREILDALRNRNPERAAHAVAAHILGAAQFIEGSIEGNARRKQKSSAA